MYLLVRRKFEREESNRAASCRFQSIGYTKKSDQSNGRGEEPVYRKTAWLSATNLGTRNFLFRSSP